MVHLPELVHGAPKKSGKASFRSSHADISDTFPALAYHLVAPVIDHDGNF
jgi:hypothetical protein